MQSLRSKIIIGLIRNRHLFSFKLKREYVDEDYDFQGFRNKVDKASVKTQKVPENIEQKPVKINEMYAEWLIPQNAPKDKVILYIHGGGFISGSCLTHRGHVSKFVNGTGIKALLFDYRLAPEHPFPAPVDDCLMAYDYLIQEGYKPENILICGESAGGTFTLSTLKALRNRGDKLPIAGVAISPLTDLNCKAKSFRTNLHKDIATLNSWHVWGKWYAGNTSFDDEILSPLLGDLSNLPPVYLCVGTYEVHLDDTVNFAKKTIKHGNRAILKKWDKMVHAFPILSPLFPEAKEAMNDICSFIKKQLL
jgi:acetyl esterase/lipase